MDQEYKLLLAFTNRIPEQDSMRRKTVDISLKKQAKQSRSLATVAAIVEAATYILKREGPSGFTTNRVAERAGVNVGSLYQYFPNKEAILFHVAKMTWEKQIEILAPLLSPADKSYADRLRTLIREFILVEAAEAELRRALRSASIDLRDTPEFHALMSEGADLTQKFFKGVFASAAPEDIDFYVDFVGLLITSFSERATDNRVGQDLLLRQADLLSDMLIGHFKVA